MGPDMKLSPSSVRRLREARNWSQEQLANAAGLSLRTIQRVETDGTASRETRVCLAAALDVEATSLADVPLDKRQRQTPDTWAAFVLVGSTMLLAAFLSGAPSTVYYMAVFFLLFGAIRYAYKSWAQAAKA
ncbi:helix-turn-helix domain-containing protein [Pseudoxanthomonas suwonensis]|uniref:helix-turn-helix domain-containing protein n=1 Tax=Pseudoxanthomonas suwonensis TaxID=314722 RepID=UPI003D18D500